MTQGDCEGQSEVDVTPLGEALTAMIAASRACLSALAKMDLAEYQQQLRVLQANCQEWQSLKQRLPVTGFLLVRLAADLRCANRAHAAAVRGSQRWMRSLNNILNPESGYGLASSVRVGSEE